VPYECVNGKECDRKRSWPDLREISHLVPEGTEKNKENFRAAETCKRRPKSLHRNGRSPVKSLSPAYTLFSTLKAGCGREQINSLSVGIGFDM
jgi:hypothetical protein